MTDNFSYCTTTKRMPVHLSGHLTVCTLVVSIGAVNYSTDEFLAIYYKICIFMIPLVSVFFPAESLY